MNWLQDFISKFKKERLLMPNENRHIEDYLNYYIDLKKPPMFAVLIKGKWGSGKTWFIDNYLNKKIKSEAQQIIKISLYGLSSADEINAELFGMLHPGLKKIKSGFLGKIVTSASKSSFLGVKVDLSDFLPNGAYAFKDDKEYIIIFDDFERSHIERNVLMGYINQFVEIHEQKVILIADESKITPSENDKESFKYNEIKEKLIGKTFTVKPNLDNALISFTKEKDDFFQEQCELIKSTYQKANHNNLRHLKQAIDDFERFLGGLDQRVLEKKQLISQLFELFLIFSIEIKAGETTANEILELQSDFGYWYKKTTQNGDEVEESNLDKFSKKYSHIRFHSPSHYLLSPNTWFEILDENNFKFEKINHELLELVNSTNIPDWKKLIEFWSLTDKQYSELIEDIELKLGQRKYSELGEIKHIFGMLLYFSENQIYSKPITEILDDAKQYIDDISRQGHLNVVAVKPKSFDGMSDSCCGYKFLSYDTNEFNELKKHLESKFSELSIPIQKEKAKQLVESINSDTTAELFEDNSFDFEGLPFLQFINVPKFGAAILSKPTYSTRELNSYLTDRYKHITQSDNNHLLEEQNFVNDCLAEFTTANSNDRSLSRLTCEHFIKLFSDAKVNLERTQIQTVVTDESQ